MAAEGEERQVREAEQPCRVQGWRAQGRDAPRLRRRLRAHRHLQLRFPARPGLPRPRRALPHPQPRRRARPGPMAVRKRRRVHHDQDAGGVHGLPLQGRAGVRFHLPRLLRIQWDCWCVENTGDHRGRRLEGQDDRGRHGFGRQGWPWWMEVCLHMILCEK